MRQRANGQLYIVMRVLENAGFEMESLPVPGLLRCHEIERSCRVGVVKVSKVSKRAETTYRSDRLGMGELGKGNEWLYSSVAL